jgi:hypothetical protein
VSAAGGDDEELRAAQLLEQLRWPDGFECPSCEARGAPYRFSRSPLALRCRECRADTSLTAETLLERTRLPLSLWLRAASIAALGPGDASPRALQAALRLGRYETAYLLSQRLRAAMSPVGELGGERALVAAGLEQLGGRSVLLLVGPADEVRLRALRAPSALAIEVELERQVAPASTLAAKERVIRVAARGAGFTTLDPKGAPSSSLARVRSALARSRLGRETGAAAQLQGALSELAFRLTYAHDAQAGLRRLLEGLLERRAPTARDLYTGRWVHPNPALAPRELARALDEGEPF